MYVPDPTPPRLPIVGALAERARRPRRTAAAERDADRAARATATSAAIDALDATARDAGAKTRHRGRRPAGPSTPAGSAPSTSPARTPAPAVAGALEDAYAERLYAKAWGNGGR